MNNCQKYDKHLKKVCYVEHAKVKNVIGKIILRKYIQKKSE